MWNYETLNVTIVLIKRASSLIETTKITPTFHSLCFVIRLKVLTTSSYKVLLGILLLNTCLVHRYSLDLSFLEQLHKFNFLFSINCFVSYIM